MDYKQKFEPRGNKVIHGAGQSFQRFREYSKAVEKNKPLIFMTYFKFNETDMWIARAKKQLKESPNLIFQIGLKMHNSKSMVADIYQGKYDKDLTKLMKTMNHIENPVFIRIGYEFDWPDRYDPKEFVRVWKYIVDFYKKMKVNNIANVWCSHPFSNSAPVEPFYPGDDYVDWFGIDLFARKYFKDDKYLPVQNFFKLAKKHKKPVMIGESTPAKVGVDKGIDSWNEWFKPYFKLIEKHSEIKAFCYISWDWKEDYNKPEWLNGKIQDNELVRKNFIKELENPKYIHDQEIRDFLDLVYT